MCLSSIILSPLYSNVKMSPYGDIHVEPERIAMSGCDFILRERGPSVCHRRLPQRARDRILHLARTTCAGFNDDHLCEKLAEKEGRPFSIPNHYNLLNPGEKFGLTNFNLTD